MSLCFDTPDSAPKITKTSDIVDTSAFQHYYRVPFDSVQNIVGLSFQSQQQTGRQWDGTDNVNVVAKQDTFVERDAPPAQLKPELKEEESQHVTNFGRWKVRQALLVLLG